jgi:hypothetical protein
MKKCIRTVFASLVVVLTMGKSAFASSAGLSGEQAVYYLKNTKGAIARLITVYNDKDRLAERERAEKNLEKLTNHPLTRPIVKQAFEDTEKEIKLYKFKFEEAERSWWNDFFAIRKTYMGK